MIEATGEPRRGIRLPGRARTLLTWAALGVCASIVGWLNFRATDDVQAVAGALLVFGFGFGVLGGRRPWLAALVLFAAVPVSSELAVLSNHPPPGSVHPIYETAIALVPAALGTLAGVGLRLLYRRSANRAAHTSGRRIRDLGEARETPDARTAPRSDHRRHRHLGSASPPRSGRVPPGRGRPHVSPD